MGRGEPFPVSTDQQTVLRVEGSLLLEIIKFDIDWKINCRFPANGALFEHNLPDTDHQAHV